MECAEATAAGAGILGPAGLDKVGMEGISKRQQLSWIKIGGDDQPRDRQRPVHAAFFLRRTTLALSQEGKIADGIPVDRNPAADLARDAHDGE
jgi:hypothetical protein